MKRFVVIATANRGEVTPHEPLDDAGQYLANRAADEADARDCRTLMTRATMGYQRERDPRLEPEETAQLARPAERERSDFERAMQLARWTA